MRRESRGERGPIWSLVMVNSDTWPEWGSGDSASDPSQDCEQMDSQTWRSLRTVSVIASDRGLVRECGWRRRGWTVIGGESERVSVVNKTHSISDTWTQPRNQSVNSFFVAGACIEI